MWEQDQFFASPIVCLVMGGVSAFVWVDGMSRLARCCFCHSLTSFIGQALPRWRCLVMCAGRNLLALCVCSCGCPVLSRCMTSLAGGQAMPPAFYTILHLTSDNPKIYCTTLWLSRVSARSVCTRQGKRPPKTGYTLAEGCVMKQFKLFQKYKSLRHYMESMNSVKKQGT